MPQPPRLAQLARLVRRTRGGRDFDLLEARLARPLTVARILTSVAQRSARPDRADLFNAQPSWAMALRAAPEDVDDDQAGDYLFGAGLALADARRCACEDGLPFAAELDVVTGLEFLPELYAQPDVEAELAATLRQRPFLEFLACAPAALGAGARAARRGRRARLRAG